MPRKKVVKSAARKKQPSKQDVKNSATNSVKLENDFLEAQARLAEQITKEISVLKQKESRLNTTLSKIQSQISKIEKSVANAKKIKTSAGKKQLATAKKVLNDTKKDYSLSIAALKETIQSLAAAVIRLARAEAFAKHLKQFNKDWAKQAKKLKNKAKAKVTTKPKAKAKTKAKAKSTAAVRPAGNKSQPPALTVIEQPHFDSSVDEADFDDVKQVIS